MPVPMIATFFTFGKFLEDVDKDSFKEGNIKIIIIRFIKDDIRRLLV